MAHSKHKPLPGPLKLKSPAGRSAPAPAAAPPALPAELHLAHGGHVKPPKMLSNLKCGGRGL